MTTLRLSAVLRGVTLGAPVDEWFDPDTSPGDLRYVLTSGDGDAVTVWGAIQVALQVGQTVPRYWYYVGKVAYRSDDPMLARNDRVLLLGNDFDGAHELRGIRLAEAADPSQLDALLIGTLALMRPDASAPAHDVPVILELPGRGHAERAPFWKGTGRHFYSRSFPDVSGDARLEWESHLASLLPRQPLVVSLLEADTQSAIGACAEDATSLRDAALRCGFRQSQQVRICDGGPVFEAMASRFHFAPGVWMQTPASLDHRHRCVIRAEDRLDAWIVEAQCSAGGIAVAAADATIRDALGERAWAYAFF